MLFAMSHLLYELHWNIVQTKGCNSLLGHAIDEFLISPVTKSVERPGLSQLKKGLESALSGKTLVSKKVVIPELEHYKSGQIRLAEIDDTKSSLSIVTLDRPGLLCVITKTIFDAGFEIDSLESEKKKQGLVEDIIMLSLPSKKKIKVNSLFKLRSALQRVL